MVSTRYNTNINNNSLPITIQPGQMALPIEPDMTDEMTDEEKQKKKRALERKEEIAIKNSAYKELLVIRQSNGGSTKYGDIQDIIKMYIKLGYK